MKGSTKKKIRRCVICVVAFIAVYIAFYVKGIVGLLVAVALGLGWIPLVVWWDWPTDEEWAKHLKELEDGGYKPRKKDELVSRREEPKPEPLSPELAELAEEIRKKLK
jgi:hypothetical protein